MDDNHMMRKAHCVRAGMVLSQMTASLVVQKELSEGNVMRVVNGEGLEKSLRVNEIIHQFTNSFKMS